MYQINVPLPLMALGNPDLDEMMEYCKYFLPKVAEKFTYLENLPEEDEEAKTRRVRDYQMITV